MSSATSSLTKSCGGSPSTQTAGTPSGMSWTGTRRVMILMLPSVLALGSMMRVSLPSLREPPGSSEKTYKVTLTVLRPRCGVSRLCLQIPTTPLLDPKMDHLG